MPNKICPGGGVLILDEKQIIKVDQDEIFRNAILCNGTLRPKGIRRTRITCPKCKRRILSSVRTCHDGCCLFHELPPHKVKHWWKKSKTLETL